MLFCSLLSALALSGAVLQVSASRNPTVTSTITLTEYYCTPTSIKFTSTPTSTSKSTSTTTSKSTSTTTSTSTSTSKSTSTSSHATTTTTAAPKGQPQGECAAVDNIIDILKLYGATPFCSSFLSIPPLTSVATVSVTATDYTTLTNTVTETGTAFVTNTLTATVTDVETDTAIATITDTLTAAATDDIIDVTATTETIVFTTVIDYTTTIVYVLSLPLMLLQFYFMISCTPCENVLLFLRLTDVASDDFTTTVATYTSTATDVITIVSTDTVTTKTVISTAAPAERRDIELPPYLTAFASSVISQACSCLSIPQSVQHVTATLTGTVTDTVEETATAEVSVTETSMATALATSLETDVVSLTDTSLVTVTQTSFTTVVTPTTVVVSEVLTDFTASQSTMTIPATEEVVATATVTTELVPTATAVDVLYCGVPGLSIVEPDTLPGGGYVSVAACYADCMANPSCLSYLYFYDGDYCALQSLPADQADYLTTAAVAGNQLAYDRDCPEP